MAYPSGEASKYYGDSTHPAGPEEYHDPPQFYNPHAPHDTYDPSGYREPEPEPYKDEPSYSLPQGQSTEPLGAGSKEEPFYAEEFNPAPLPRSARNLRAWRYQQGRRLWTQGSRPRCLCRFFCCTVLIAIFLVIIIVLCLALWARPPNIIIGGDNTTSAVTTQSIEPLSDGIQVNLGLDVEVINPNYFSVELTRVTADIIYPINNTRIGNGTFKNLKLPAHSRTNFTFPFMFAYEESIDPNLAIITDLASKCLGSRQSNLSLRYSITVAVKVFFFTISPTISNAISFACPISSSDLQVRLFIFSTVDSFVKVDDPCLEQTLAKEVGLDLQKIIGSISS
ncbi:hypothetical protein BC826DRAFT_1143440 [Russula brevipes]|nr:hypothetical protein BC826DRAFT_1143440 [Russula brevipes]